MNKILEQVSSLSLQDQIQKLESIPDLNKVGLGWLRFTCSTSYLTYWKKRLKSYFRTKFQSRGKGWNGYLESLTGNFSIIIAYTPVLTLEQRQALGIRQSPNEGFMTVDIPQSALDSLAETDLLRFWIDVYGCDGIKFTRVDVYYDDYCKLISPEQVHTACKRGGVGVPRLDNIRGWDEYSLQNGNSLGYTVYFGSNKSDKQIRFYDKFAESDGKQDCYRWEAQLNGATAKAFQNWFVEALGEAIGLPTVSESVKAIANAYKSVIRGSISFYDIPLGSSPKELPQNWAARSELTWWWKELLAGLEPAKLVVNRVLPSLAGVACWIKNQVAPSLALLKMAYQHWGIPFWEWLKRELEQGEERWSEHHYRLIEEALITSPAV